MITDAAVAKKISDLMLDLFVQVDNSIASVKETCLPDEAAAYQRGAGRIEGAIVLDVLEPLYHKHPALKPHNWDR